MKDLDVHKKIAVLIDADNAQLAKLKAVLDEISAHGHVLIKRAYGDWSIEHLKNWKKPLNELAIQPIQQFAYTTGKNSTDASMIIDAMDLLFRGRVTGFGIMSSDSDFMPLAMRIRQDGYPVYGFGGEKTPEAFRQACSRFIDVGALIRAEKEERQNEASEGLDKDLLNLLFDAYAASKRDEQGYAKLSEVGQRAGNRSSFDTRNYGFSRLIDLIESIPNFAAERMNNGQVYIKRLR